MKQLLIGLLFIASTSAAYAGSDPYNILCKCNVDVGDSFEITDTIDIHVDLEEDGGYFEATSAEIAILVSYKCFKDRNNVQRIHKVNSVSCDGSNIATYNDVKYE